MTAMNQTGCRVKCYWNPNIFCGSIIVYLILFSKLEYYEASV